MICWCNPSCSGRYMLRDRNIICLKLVHYKENEENASENMTKREIYDILEKIMDTSLDTCPIPAKLPQEFDFKKYPGMKAVIENQIKEYEQCKINIKHALENDLRGLEVMSDGTFPAISKQLNSFPIVPKSSKIAILRQLTPDNELIINNRIDSLYLFPWDKESPTTISGVSWIYQWESLYFRFNTEDIETAINIAHLTLKLLEIKRNPTRFWYSSIVYEKSQRGDSIIIIDWGKKVTIPWLIPVMKSIPPENILEILSYIESVLQGKSSHEPIFYRPRA